EVQDHRVQDLASPRRVRYDCVDGPEVVLLQCVETFVDIARVDAGQAMPRKVFAEMAVACTGLRIALHAPQEGQQGGDGARVDGLVGIHRSAGEGRALAHQAALAFSGTLRSIRNASTS